MNTAVKSQLGSNARATALLSRSDDLMWFDSIEGERSAIHVSSAQSGGAFGIMESVAAPGSASPLHYHREDEVFFIIEGLATIAVDGVIHRAGPGTTILAPAGAFHAWKNATTSPLRMLVTFTPGGIEAMFQQLAGKPLHEIVDVAKSYGTYVVGPAIA